jgi:hypothetical protein
MRKSENIDKIMPALLEAQKTLEAVPKKGKNLHFGNKYAELSDVLAEVVPKLNSLNIFLTQTVDQNCLLTTFLHTSGQWIESAIPLINKKGDDQGQGGSITYAKRYGLLSILGIPTEDDDGNTASISHQPGKIHESIPNRAPYQDNTTSTPKSGVSYTFDFGKYAGKTIDSIKTSDLESYRNFLIKNGEPKGKAKVAYEEISAYLSYNSNIANEHNERYAPEFTDDDIPPF